MVDACLDYIGLGLQTYHRAIEFELIGPNKDCFGALASSTQQHLILPLLLGHVFILDASRMLESSRQHPPHIQIAHIDRFILRFCTSIYTRFQYIELDVGVHRKEERQGVSFLASAIPNAVYSSWKLAVGLSFEVLAYVANKRARLGRCVNPYSVLV